MNCRAPFQIKKYTEYEIFSLSDMIIKLRKTPKLSKPKATLRASKIVPSN